MDMFRLDRTFFKKQTAEEADQQQSYWQSKTYEERLAAAMYLNSIAWNFDLNNPPRMDRTYFTIKKREAGG